tara:strand:+ start:1762 stop:2328 length:567 start_codon:yes stop_codon:yes gene_type:complete
MIVTKNQSSQDINELISQGFKLFGENRVQEAKLKYQSISSCNNLELHLIGPLQTNKVKNALKIFDVIQTIDRISLVDEIAKQLLKLSSVRTKKFYIQVNIGEEEQKSGVFKKNLQDLYNYSINCNLVIHGLMCIPPNTQDPSNYFKEMIKIRDNINKKLKLSMGMSNDYKIALNFQSDIIRIGSLIFE